jgi:hypothetical protein
MSDTQQNTQDVNVSVDSDGEMSDNEMQCTTVEDTTVLNNKNTPNKVTEKANLLLNVN